VEVSEHVGEIVEESENVENVEEFFEVSGHVEKHVQESDNVEELVEES